MNQATRITDTEHQELTTLYEVTANDLYHFKGQQWSLAYFATLGFAAIVGVSRFPELNLGPCGSFLLCLVASLVFGLAVYLLWQLKTSLEVRRDRLSRIREEYSEAYRRCWGQKKQVIADQMFAFLFLVLLIGLGFVWWLVYFS